MWISVVIAAFFCGSRWNDIKSSGENWWKVTRVRWGASVSSNEGVMWPRGSITINHPQAFKKITSGDAMIATITADHQLRVSPKEDGKFSVEYQLSRGNFSTGTLDLEVTNGRIADWALSSR